MKNTDLRTAAAYHFLGLSTTDYLVDVAHTALENGIYAHGLGEIATMRYPTLAEVGPFFDSALKELHIVVPNWELAIDRISEVTMIALAEGDGTPRKITNQVYNDFARLSFESRSLGPLLQLIDHFYRYDMFYDDHGRIDHLQAAGHDLECISLAKRWCRERWQHILDPAWLSTTVIALAQGIYDEHAFDRLPILADALQDAGCDHADILDHCRGSGPHVRGCWVVDLVLGKE